MSQAIVSYRTLLRELSRTNPSRKGTLAKAPAKSLRIVYGQQRDSWDSEAFLRTVGSAQTFLRAQREHQELLTRYNPLHDLTAEEHLKATANRVGLNMPLEVNVPKE